MGRELHLHLSIGQGDELSRGSTGVGAAPHLGNEDFVTPSEGADTHHMDVSIHCLLGDLGGGLEGGRG